MKALKVRPSVGSNNYPVWRQSMWYLMLGVLVAASCGDSSAELRSVADGFSNQAAKTHRPDGQQEIILQHGFPRRNLPFQINVDSSDPPTKLDEVVEALYRGIPEEHLKFIAKFLGNGNYREVQDSYTWRIDFQRDLYATEIVREAWKEWGYSDEQDDPFAGTMECVGERFSFYILLHVGMRYISERLGYTEIDRDRLVGFQQAYAASSRLFQVCEDRAQLVNFR